MIRTGVLGGVCVLVLSSGGCATPAHDSDGLQLGAAIERYQAKATPVVHPGPAHVRHWAADAFEGRRAERGRTTSSLGLAESGGAFQVAAGRELDYPTFGLYPAQQTTQPAEAVVEAETPSGVPEGYWKDDLWRQMGSEGKRLVLKDFWTGYRKAFWRWDSAALIGVAWGASITIRETGVDDTVRDRIHHHRQLGDMDETLQIIGNPGTHFAAAGVVWLGSTLAKDAQTHEFAKSLTQALAVNGVTTMALKSAALTRSPDGERHAWPSGHTSSAFTFAAVANEYYGPWVGIPSFALAGLVGYQRLDSRTHDFSDVVFGAVLGYVVGANIAKENKGEMQELFGMKVVPYTDPQTGSAGLALYKSY